MKERLDTILFQNGLAESREKAKSMVMSGIVYIDEVKTDKPGTKVPTDSNIIIRGKTLAYVSRGGLKLEKAMAEFNLSLEGQVTMDIGASTGGFTDCMLQNGAIKVYAIDVGYGQLAWKLRTDAKVVCMERTNIRYVTPEMIGEYIDFASIDVSFISLQKVLPSVYSLLKNKSQIVALIKPQFEAGRGKVGKKGVVRDINTHLEVINDIINFSFTQLNFSVVDLTYSPVRGPEGNIEYLLLLQKNIEEDAFNKVDEKKINEIVENSHINI